MRYPRLAAPTLLLLVFAAFCATHEQQPLEWLAGNGIATSLFQISYFDDVPWLIAKKNIKQGDTIMTLPPGLAVISTNVPSGSFNKLQEILESDLIRLALVVLDNPERYRLHDAAAPGPAVFWEDLAALEGSPVVATITRTRDDIRGIHAALTADAAALSAPLPLRDFEAAVAYVLANSFELPLAADGADEPAVATVLAPGASLARHSPNATAGLVVDTETGAVSLRALALIPQGAEITVSRGAVANEYLFLRSGAAVVANPHDRYVLHMVVDASEENLALKSAIMQAAGLPPANMSVALEASAFPEALFSAMRVHFASREEVGSFEAALKGDIISLENELRVCRALLSTISDLLGGYPTTLADDAERLQHVEDGTLELGARELAALKYIFAEKRLLTVVGSKVQLHWLELLTAPAAPAE
eukprot:gnl/Chilomastix_cuspidata/2125.p2 GENE.gnl/Chilomastix_cuspidata/2125~~gnl/Chilomastix_cuspidata/2125.p2  ORF type:complete len:420 (-),score=197.09 gnl/Chilomastix_cuspidata/2125:75-1334(-)